MRLSNRSVLSSLILAGLVGACGSNSTTSPTIGSKTSTHGAVSTPVAIPQQFIQSENILSDKILRYFPQTSLGVIISKSPRHFAQSTRIEKILKDYPDVFKPFIRSTKTSNGGDIANPMTWEKLGANIDAPFAFGIVAHEKSEYIQLSVALSDVDTFSQSIYELAMSLEIGPTSASVEEGQTVLRFGKTKEITVIHDESHAKILLSLTRSRAESDVAYATNSKLPTADSEDFRKQLPKAEFGATLAGFVRFEEIAELMNRVRDRFVDHDWYSKQMDELQRKLEQAMSSGASEERIARIQQDLNEAIAGDRRRKERASLQQRLATEVIGSLNTVSFGAKLGEKRSIVRLQANPKADSLWRKLLGTESSPLAFPTAMKAHPLFLLAAHLAPSEKNEALRDLYEIIDGSVIDDSENFFGLNLSTLLPQIQNEVGFATSLFPTDEGQFLAIDIAAELKEGHSLKTPERNRVPGPGGVLIEVDVSDSRLDIHSKRDVSPEFSLRLSSDDKSLLKSPANQVAMIFDPSLILGMIAFNEHHGGFYDSGSRNAQKRKEIQEEIRKLDLEKQKLVPELIVKASQSMGPLVAGLRNHNSGFAVLAQVEGTAQDITEGLQTMIEALVPEAEYMRTGKIPKALELEKKRRKLVDQLEELYN